MSDEHRPAHGPAPAASRHTRRIVAAVLIPAAVATLVAMIVLWPGRVPKEDDSGNGQQALATVSPTAPAPPTCTWGTRWCSAICPARCPAAARTR